ncbi:methyltransferase [Methanosarcina sp. WWM596]|uniref:methyltransferase n=1 Tax=Methanosarcina sp. WWM596 TaxID=1434103 RepID=UPI000615D108|nr:methyltransferase [Methanosarcina sp. WWM596]AKB17321.1 C-20 methyltransferase BchU [Methanosarcina sp. WWM596]
MEKLTDIKPPLEDKNPFLRDLAANFKKGQVFQTALELDVFTKLKTPMTAEAISRETGTDPVLTGRFLDVLVALCLLAKNDGAYVTPADLYPFLADDGLYYSKQLLLSKEEKRNWLNLKEILIHGPQEKEKPDYQYFYDRKSMELIARSTLLGRLQKILKIVIALPEFQAARRLIDFGGGHGLFGIGLAQENPYLEVVIFDRPGMAEISREFIGKYGMEKRVRAVSGDYVKDKQGAEYDIALEILSFESNLDDVKQFYQNVAGCLRPGGIFIIQAFAIKADRTGPLNSLLHDLYKKIAGRNMYMMSSGEIREALEDAGFEAEYETEFHDAIPTQLIIARKKDPHKS